MAPEHPILLVGSIPGADAEAVFRACAPALRGQVPALPDGETGQRRIWVVYIAANVLVKHPEVQAINRPRPVGSIENEWRTPEEDWVPSSFEDMWLFKVNDTVRQVRFDSLGYAAHAIESFAVFERLRGEGVIAQDARFQVCLPLAESGLRWFTAGRRDYEILKPAYDAALERDLESILSSIPHERLCIQWDVCMEILAAELNDCTGQPPLAWALPDTPVERWLAALNRFSEPVPEAVKLGLRLCYGDLGHVHMVEPKDLGQSVKMANLGCRAAGRRIDFVHMAVPRDRSDAAYFMPLTALDIGDATPYLGLVHMTDGEAGTRRRIEAAKTALSDFGIATECGFGRRPATQLPDLLDIHLRVLDAL